MEANGLRLQIFEWGVSGTPPALLLHSLAAHSHWWDWTAPLLADRFHVVALDLRGHGGSQWAEPPAYGFIDYVGDVVALADRLGWRSPLVIGHSLGGYVGAYLASRYPARVGALVVADMLTAWSEAEERRAVELAERSPLRFTSPAEAGARFGLAPPDTRASREWLQHLGESGVRARPTGGWEHAFDRRVFLHPRPDPWPFLPGVGCPTLVVRGSGSAVMDRETWLQVTTAVRRGQFAELKHAFHHLILDEPQGFVAVVQKWLATVGEGKGT
ncbi:MAG: alpha/beta hydrolase [Candidatus Rokubacteria bacterium]|nr:alpha/beta hydrolase [Candidatus Rokubacteria bacterium]